uniref:Uncharacterized protein n=1 Tax=viral metagenome TaxID=1070528 RepID=A0A6H2A6J7_9ZZZZ
MAKCRRCGEETCYGRVCSSCMRKWLNRRARTFAQAEKELGPLSANNLAAIQKRVKQLEATETRQEKEGVGK